MTNRALLALAALAAIGCGKRREPEPAPAPVAAEPGPADPAPAPSPPASAADQQGARCERVADHLLTIMKDELDQPGAPAPERRAQIIDGCRKENLDAAQEACILASTSLEAMARCEHPSSAPPPDEATGDPPPTPRPIDHDLRARCERIVAHVFVLMEKELPAENRKEMLRQLESEQRSVVEACEREKVSAAQETCALAAASMADLDKCSE
jgi:hypothetical protein